MSAEAESNAETKPAPLMVRALRGEPVERIPVWMMRQAGRYLPEYHEVRAEMSFLELCENAPAAVEVSLQPWRRFGVDGVVFFSDILLPLSAMGMPLEFNPGPVLAKPIATSADVAALPSVDVPHQLGFQGDILKELRRELPAETAVIGFAGAPFTMACYAIEGQSNKDLKAVKRMIMTQPDVLHDLLQHLVPVLSQVLLAQAKAGADVVQLFDTWAGQLSPRDFLTFALPYARSVLQRLRDVGVPTIYYTQSSGGVLHVLRDLGADAYSLDWRVDISVARMALGHDRAAQGNFDPLLLLGDGKQIPERVREMVTHATAVPGYVGNLGHGIIPETPVENVATFVQAVKDAPPEYLSTHTRVIENE